MPRVPQYEGFVKTTPLRIPDAQVNPLLGAVGAVADQVERFRKEAQQVVDDEAELGLVQTAEQLRREAMQVRGTAAIENVTKTVDAFQTRSQEVVAKLPPSARARFANRVLRQRMQLEDSLTDHALKEQTDSYLTQRNALLENATDRARRFAREGNIDESYEATRDAQEILEEMVTNRMTPWAVDPNDKETAESVVRTRLSAVRGAQLEGLYAGKHFKEAKLLLEEWGDQLTEQDREKAQQGYRLATEQDQINTHYTKAMAIADPKERADYIATIADEAGNRDASLQTSVRNAVNSAVGAEEDARSQQQQQIVRGVKSAMALPENRGRTARSMLSDREQQLLGEDAVQSLDKIADEASDARAFSEWDAMLRTPEGAKEIAKMTWADAQARFFSRMATHRAGAENDFDTIRAGRAIGGAMAEDAAARRESLISNAQRTASVAERFGLKLSAAQEGALPAPSQSAPVREQWERRYADFQTAADRALQQFLTTEKRTVASPEETQAILESVALQQVRIDRNRSESNSLTAAQISSDLEDEVVYGSTDELAARAALATPEDRLRMYVPASTLEQYQILQFAGLPQARRQKLGAAAASRIQQVRAGLRLPYKANFSEIQLMRMGAALLIGDDEMIRTIGREP